jgi:hypothetical protein
MIETAFFVQTRWFLLLFFGDEVSSAYSLMI